MVRDNEQYLDPRWQRKRLEILERDNWTCQKCQDAESTLHVHHRYYIKGRKIWEYGPSALVTLCEDCHAEETENIASAIEILIMSFRTCFFANEIHDIGSSVGISEPGVPSEVWASAISWLFCTPSAQSDFLNLYFADCHKRIQSHREQLSEHGAIVPVQRQNNGTEDFWQKCIDAVRAKLGPGSAGLLSVVNPSKFENGILTLEFGPTNQLHKRLFESGERKSQFESVFSDVIGQDILLQIS